MMWLHALRCDNDDVAPCIEILSILDCGGKSAIVTNTTVEIVVPEDLIGSVYGESGCNLNRLRQISGAQVAMHDPRPGTRESIVIISGTPDQTQAAQSLLQAFILSGQSSSPDHRPRATYHLCSSKEVLIQKQLRGF
ncbi:hypothetical protein Scep_001867 [Stephania cephalantha]|uniref:K Homology domain-containing protein n=1 Tax=Stephania cephalantha TaxID=152367 RepID=A0AAP0Q869_9MAGN